MSDAPPPGPAGTPCPVCGDRPHPDGPCPCTFTPCACMRMRQEKREAWDKAMMTEWGRREFIASQAAPAAPVEARVAESIPFVASRGESGAPTWCPTCGNEPDVFGCYVKRPDDGTCRDPVRGVNPGPWRLTDSGSLWDANGDLVLYAECYGGESSVIHASERSGEMIRAAPELEALVRCPPLPAMRCWCMGHFGKCIEVDCGCWACAREALLARLDAAAKR